MAKKPNLTIEQLRQLLDYDPETGIFVWLVRGPEWFSEGFRTAQGNANNWNSAHVGKPAGYKAANGYFYLSLPRDGKMLAHRVAFAITHNKWPEICDHINGDPSDNRAANLQSGTHQDNLRNARKWSHNTSGVTGVARNKRQNTWTAFIKVDQKNVFLGNRKNFDEAVSLRKAAEQKYGFTARHGL